MRKFIGRARELALLEQQQNKLSGSLVVVRGRPRIGKSQLNKDFLVFLF